MKTTPFVPPPLAPLNLTRRRRRSVSRDRDENEDAAGSDDDNASTARAAAALNKRSRRRDASPVRPQRAGQPRRRWERADHELSLAMPSLFTSDVVVDSRDLPAFVRTVVKNKPHWSYTEIDALTRVTGAHSRRAACWDFEFGTLVLDWWATTLPPRNPRPRALFQQAGPLTRELIEAIVNARCEDNVYRLVVRAATLLYLVCCAFVCVIVLQLQGDSTPRNLQFAVTNCGARVELITTNWTRMLLADIEVIRVPHVAQRRRLPVTVHTGGTGARPCRCLRRRGLAYTDSCA